MHLTVSPDPQPEQVIFIRSDQYAFVKQGIPAMLTDAGMKSDNPAIQPKTNQDTGRRRFTIRLRTI